MNSQILKNEHPEYKHCRNMLKCPQGDGTKHYYAHVYNTCGLFFPNPHTHILHRLADVDKVLYFLLCSHVGHIKWPAELVVCAQTQ